MAASRQACATTPRTVTECLMGLSLGRCSRRLQKFEMPHRARRYVLARTFGDKGRIHQNQNKWLNQLCPGSRRSLRSPTFAVLYYYTLICSPAATIFPRPGPKDARASPSASALELPEGPVSPGTDVRIRARAHLSPRSGAG